MCPGEIGKRNQLTFWTSTTLCVHLSTKMPIQFAYACSLVDVQRCLEIGKSRMCTNQLTALQSTYNLAYTPLRTDPCSAADLRVHRILSKTVQIAPVLTAHCSVLTLAARNFFFAEVSFLLFYRVTLSTS